MATAPLALFSVAAAGFPHAQAARVGWTLPPPDRRRCRRCRCSWGVTRLRPRSGSPWQRRRKPSRCYTARAAPTSRWAARHGTAAALRPRPGPRPTTRTRPPARGGCCPSCSLVERACCLFSNGRCAGHLQLSLIRPSEQLRWLATAAAPRQHPKRGGGVQARSLRRLGAARRAGWVQQGGPGTALQCCSAHAASLSLDVQAGCWHPASAPRVFCEAWSPCVGFQSGRTAQYVVLVHSSPFHAYQVHGIAPT